MFELILNGLEKENVYYVVIRSIQKTIHSLALNRVRTDIIAWEIIWLSKCAYPEKIGLNPEYQRQITCLGKDILKTIQSEVAHDRKNIPIYINLAV